MGRVMRLFGGFAGAALAAAPPPCRAAGPETLGQWTITPLAQSCLVSNRPLRTMNASPWNSLTFLAQKGGGLSLQVHYWPGYFESPHGAALHVSTAGSSAIDTILGVEAMGSGAVAASARLPAPVADELRRAEEVTVGIGPQQLTFDLVGLAGALDALDACRARLK